VTAKAGRPDTNRAGNESKYYNHFAEQSAKSSTPVLRTVVEGRIPWRFLPVTYDLAGESELQDDSNGIWLPEMTDLQAPDGRHISDDESDKEEANSDIDDDASGTEDSDGISNDAGSGEEGTSRPQVIGVQSRFAALNLGNDDASEESEGESSD
jgi:hypothetical protein